MNDPSSDILTARVLDYLVGRARQNAGLVRLDNREIAWTVYGRFPADGRPSMGQVERALRELRRRNIIRRGRPLSRVVRIAPPAPR